MFTHSVRLDSPANAPDDDLPFLLAMCLGHPRTRRAIRIRAEKVVTDELARARAARDRQKAAEAEKLAAADRQFLHDAGIDPE